MTGQTRKRKGKQVQTRAESPDNTESPSSEDRSGQSGPAPQHVTCGQPLFKLPTEQALDTTVATTPTSASVQIWEIIIDQLLAYRPGNGWALTCNPNEQSLKGEAAQSFLNCRATCTAFDHYMLGQLSRFTMRPIKYLRDPVLFKVEFEQRQFRVSATSATSRLNNILYSECRRYSRELLRARRDLIRTNEVHDNKPRLRHDDPEVQFWVDLDEASQAGPIGRQSSPWFRSRQSAPLFLSRDDRNEFHRQCMRTTWTQAEYDDKIDEADARQEVMDAVFSRAAGRDNADQQASPEQSNHSDAPDESGAHQEQADCENTSQEGQATQETGCLR